MRTLGIHLLSTFFEVRERVIPRLRALLFFLVTGFRFKRIGAHTKLLGLQKMEIGRSVALGDFCWIQTVIRYGGTRNNPTLSIGDGVSISDLTHISCVQKISIGAGCLLGSKIYIGDHSHGSMEDWDKMHTIAPGDRPLGDIEDVVIGERVWIGDGSVVLAGSRIAAGSVIGANSVVKLQVDRPALIAGAPARVIRFFETNSNPVDAAPSGNTSLHRRSNYD